MSQEERGTLLHSLPCPLSRGTLPAWLASLTWCPPPACWACIQLDAWRQDLLIQTGWVGWDFQQSFIAFFSSSLGWVIDCSTAAPYIPEGTSLASSLSPGSENPHIPSVSWEELWCSVGKRRKLVQSKSHLCVRLGLVNTSHLRGPGGVKMPRSLTNYWSDITEWWHTSPQYPKTQVTPHEHLEQSKEGLREASTPLTLGS